VRGRAGSGRGFVGRVYYGWVMVGVSTVATVATSPGQSFLVGTFNEAIRADLGLSLSGLSLAYLVATFCASLPLTLVGKAGDRFGTRRVMAVVAAGLGVACWLIGGGTWLASRVGEEGGVVRWWAVLVALTAAFFLLRFLGQGALGLVSSHVLAMWFERRLGLAESVRHLGMPLANAVLPGLVLGLIAVVGWRGAYGALGVAVWLVVLPMVWLLYVNRPEDVGQHIDGGRVERVGAERRSVDPDEPLDLEVGGGIAEPPGAPVFTLGGALRTRVYWTVVGCLMANALAGTAFVFHVQPMVLDLGLTKGAGAGVMATFGVSSLLMTLPAGWLCDRLSLRGLLGLATVGLGASCALYASSAWSGEALVVLHLAYGVLGLSQALMFVLASPILARYFGRPHHGAIRGSMTTFMVVGTSVGPFAMSWGRDVLGTFYWPYLGVAVAAVPLSVLALVMSRPGRG